MMAQIPYLKRKDAEHVFSAVNSFLGVLVHYRSHAIRKALVDRVDLVNAHCRVKEDYAKLVRW